MDRIIKIYLSLKGLDGNSEVQENSLSWIEKFKSYFSYALEERCGFKVQFIGLEDFKEAFNDKGIFFYFPVISQQNVEEPSLHSEVSNLNALALGENKVYTFKILTEPVTTDQLPLELIDDRNYNFFAADKHTGSVLTGDDLLKEDNLKTFLFRVFDLAFDSEKIVASTLAKGTELTEGGKAPKLKVFLAETGHDLLQERLSIERELVRLGYAICPQKPYPVDQDELVERTKNDLSTSVLSVHLFGKYFAKPRPGKEVSLADFQNQLAAQYFLELSKVDEDERDNRFKRIIWVPEGVEIEDEKQRKFLNDVRREYSLHAGADIISCPLEELKDIITDRLLSDSLLNNPTSSANRATSEEEVEEIEIDVIRESIYLIHNQVEDERLNEVKSILEAKGKQVMSLAESVQNLNYYRQRHRQYLLQCHAIVFYTNNFNLHWLRSKMNDILKSKGWGRRNDFAYILVLSDKLDSIPNENIYQSVKFIQLQDEISADLFDTEPELAD